MSERRSPETPFEQLHITVPRSARYAVLGSFDAPAREVWIVCHGHGQLAARFLSRFRPLDNGARIVIAPEALSRYYLAAPTGEHGANTPVGATWMTREDRENEIADYIRYLDLVYEEVFRRVRRDAVRLIVLGFSQGVATAARWVAAGKPEPDRVILWAGMLPTDVGGGGLRSLSNKSPVVLPYGDADEFATVERVRANEEMMRQAGASFQTVRFAGGHEIVDSVLLQVAADGSA